MNFLDLCRQVKEEAGLSAAAIASVTSATGIDAKIVKWVQQAWERVQAYPWRTLSAELTFTTTVGKQAYNVATDLSHTDVREFDLSVAKLADGTTISKLTWLDYFTEYRPQFFYSAPQTDKPRYITYVNSSNEVMFESVPASTYTVTLPYIMTAERLAANTDVPTLPEEMHWLIVWRALMFYAAYDNAPTLYGAAERNYQEMMQTAGNLLISPILIGAEPMA